MNHRLTKMLKEHLDLTIEANATLTTEELADLGQRIQLEQGKARSGLAKSLRRIDELEELEDAVKLEHIKQERACKGTLRGLATVIETHITEVASGIRSNAA